MKNTAICFFICIVLCREVSPVLAGSFDPPDGFVFDAAHQHPDDLVIVFGNENVSMVSGGLIGSYLNIRDTANFEMDGGTVQSYIWAESSATFTMRGGTVAENILADGTSTVNIYGGSFSVLALDDRGTINIYGTNLQPYEAGVIGTLADGTPLNAGVVEYFGNSGVTLNLINVPEPSTFFLMGFGVTALVIRAVWLPKRRCGSA